MTTPGSAIIQRRALAALAAFVLSGLASGTLCAGTLPFGIAGSPIDLSVNGSESILPGGKVFEESQPLFGTLPVPKQSAHLLHLSGTGVNGSGRSTNISDAFASSLAESDGNGGVGVSQLIFGLPSATDPAASRQMVATSLWTQTFVNNGSNSVQVTLHLHIPSLQVQLLGVAPRRDSPSATETAEARATVQSSITHPDLTIVAGGQFDFGLHEFERQIPSGTDLINLADVKALGQTGAVVSHVDFNGDDFNPAFTISSVSTDVKLGTLQPGDTLSYVYTLMALGTTHGFEHGYDAFLGDPFGADVVGDNLGVTVSLAVASQTPLPAALPLFASGLGALGLFGRCRKRKAASFA